MKFKYGKNRQGKTTSFSKILPDMMNEFELEQSFTVEHLTQKWPDIVGDIISTHSIPDRVFRKTLFIAVDHSVFANEIMMMKDAIIKSIGEVFSPDLIKNIRTETKKLSWKN